MKDEIQGLRQVVEDVMTEVESTRNSDKKLIFMVLNRKKLITDTGHGYFILKKNIPELPSFQSIRLVRQIIQNQEKRLLPTDPEVRRMRRINEEEMKNIHKWDDTSDDDINALI